MAQHRVKRTHRKPSFFWQGVLILAPMLVLAKLGALAIWQDKRMAQHEAELRAQDLAEQAVEKWAADWIVSPSTNSDSLRVDFDGKLIAPKPIRNEIVAEAASMTPEQSQLLYRARAAEFLMTNRAEAIALFQEFLDTAPSRMLGQQARYSMALLHQSVGDATNAARIFHNLLNDPTPAWGDAGGDLKTLSMLKLALMSQSGFDAVCSNAVANPTPLTPQILRFLFASERREAKESAAAWWAVWQSDQLKRHLWSRVRHSFASNVLAAKSAPGSINAVSNSIVTSVPGLIEFKAAEPIPSFWIGARDETEFSLLLEAGVRNKASTTLPGPYGRLDLARLVEPRPTSDSHTLAFWTAAALAEWAKARTASLRAPEYFDVSASLAGYDVIRPEDLPALRHIVVGKGGGQFWSREHRTNAPPTLATASRTVAGNLTFIARVHLIGPELLFEQQQARSTWFKSVIGVAALTSIIGFVSAYRAFHKQLRLAELKSNFVSSVSHELRAPIASVRLMAEGLERGKISDPSKQREYFRFITQECRRLSSMIENVLDFARIEQGRKEYEPEPTDVSALVEQTVKLMEPYAAERGVKLRNAECETRSAEPAHEEASLDSVLRIPHSAFIDGQAIQQALVNLIDNAIKHSPSGEEVAVDLTFNPQLSTLNLSVSDRGPGIPAAEHEKIFKRFYRLGSELRRETPGVGIGLSIVKHIVEAHGGRVCVESEAGNGSRFIIEIPVTAETQRRREKK